MNCEKKTPSKPKKITTAKFYPRPVAYTSLRAQPLPAFGGPRIKADVVNPSTKLTPSFTISEIPERKFAERQSNLEKAKKRRDGMDKLSPIIRSAIRASESVGGSCSFSSECAEPAQYRCAQSTKPVRYCQKHALLKADKRDDIVDSRGLSIVGATKKKGNVLFVYSTHWVFKPKPASISNFTPGSPKQYSVLFCNILMRRCVKMALEGMAVNKIWRIAREDLPSRIPLEIYKRFNNALIVPWMIISFSVKMIRAGKI